MARKLTLKEIDAQITKLQQQASDIRESEKTGVVDRMREAIAYYGITAADLGFEPGAHKGRKANGKVVRAKATAAGRIKYKDDAGHTWSGFGRKPKWFVDAVAAGKTEADLRA